jgi:hypothetical protein
MSCRVISQWIFSNHLFTYLWNDIYGNLVVKTVDLNLFSLLGSSSSSSVDASLFGCVVILSVYLTLNFVISSLIVGTFKSVCKTLLDTYQAAFTISRRTLFWYLYNISMFELLAVPQRGIPYVQMGMCPLLTKTLWYKTWFLTDPRIILVKHHYAYQRIKIWEDQEIEYVRA